MSQVVERAAITNIVSKHVAGKEHTAYTHYCQPREGFGWSITKRFSDFAALRLVSLATPRIQHVPSDCHATNSMHRSEMWWYACTVGVGRGSPGGSAVGIPCAMVPRHDAGLR